MIIATRIIIVCRVKCDLGGNVRMGLCLWLSMGVSVCMCFELATRVVIP